MEKRETKLRRAIPSASECVSAEGFVGVALLCVGRFRGFSHKMSFQREPQLEC